MPKTIAFSDIHLSQHFNEAKFIALSSVITQADQVIINGDFWDSYETTFDQFLNSPWKQLFPLLKSRHAVYLYGNHDSEASCDHRVSLFSDAQSDHYRYQNLYFCHGHQLHPGLSRLESSSSFPLLHKLSQLIKSIENFLAPPSPYLIAKLFFYRQLDNFPLINYAKTKLPPDQILVCGHTHSPYFSLKDRYINLGDVISHRLSYLEINHSNKLKLVRLTY